MNLKKSSALTPEGKRVLKMLMERYGMSEPNAVKLLHDGGIQLAIALLSIVR